MNKPKAPPAELGAWGRDDLMAVAAVRYCLGRMTYITSDCSEWLVQQWPNIKPSARAAIQRDIDEAFARDDEARAAGDTYRPLGWDCDRAVWQKVRDLWAHGEGPRIDLGRYAGTYGGYTAPPQRKPLTDAEIEMACVPLGAAMLSFTEVARAIERAHGITTNERK